MKLTVSGVAMMLYQDRNGRYSQELLKLLAVSGIADTIEAMDRKIDTKTTPDEATVISTNMYR